MKKLNLLPLVSAFFTAIAVAFISCGNAKHADQEEKTAEKSTVQQEALPYDLTKPTIYNMPQNLFEISGICFQNGDSKQVYAIQDEDGDLFKLGLNDKEDSFTKFGGSGDYEDLTIINNYVIVLKSNGELHTFALAESQKPKAENVVKSKDLVPKAEYEGLAADEASGNIYILSKEIKKSDVTEVYSFKFKQGEFTAGKTFSLSHNDIAQLAGENKLKFKPSALAKNPKTNEWYILSSVNKLLVVTDADFKLKGAYPLKANYFNQPEGIAFDRDNNLYISNEGGTLSSGTILQFKLN